MVDLQPSNKKRKRRRQVDETELPPEEQARRQRQRELQQMAIKLRAQGQEYDARACKAQLARKRSSQKSKRKSKGSKYQVVILPIYWKQREHEHQAVMSCCRHAADLLGAAGLTCYTDMNNHLSPGQRMRRWEEEGVKVRLEIGPQDAEQSLCIMARSQPQPGMVAHKCTGAVDDTLVTEVQRLLDMPDDQVPAGDFTKYEAKQAEEGRQQKQHGSAAGEEAGHDRSKSQEHAGQRKRALHQDTGDALEDDFEDAAAEDAPQQRPKKHKRHKPSKKELLYG